MKILTVVVNGGVWQVEVFMQDIHEQILSIEKHLTHIRIENWLNQDVFSWQWWLLIIVLIVPWVIWWRYVDKKRLLEIFSLGLVSLIISSYLDAVITELGLWSYHVWLVFLWPRLIPADFTVIPVTFMFIYQKFSSWAHYIIGNYISGLRFCWRTIFSLD